MPKEAQATEIVEENTEVVDTSVAEENVIESNSTDTDAEVSEPESTTNASSNVSSPVTEQELTDNQKAPRVTENDVESVIKAEHYFTAYEGVLGERFVRGEGESDAGKGKVPKSLGLLTICVLTLENGFTILGQSASASYENFNQDIGRRIARSDAVNKIWPLLGYQLRDRLHALKQPGEL